MATILGKRPAPARPLAPDTYEKVLGVAACVLFAAMIAAIVRGHAEWSKVPLLIWLHLATIGTAVALTPVMLLRRRGDRPHRLLGTIWVIAMLATALLSLGIHVSNPNGFSFIHILSVWTIVQTPIIWWSARHHKLDKHRGSVRAMVTGALLIAGFFTFPFHRLLGHWLFG